MALLFAFATLLVLATVARSEVRVQQLQRLPGVWSAVQWQASNGSGVMARDVLGEAVFRQAFDDGFRAALATRTPVLGAVLDPVWLWPVEERVKRDVFEADLIACDLHMHNFKEVRLVDLQVFRDASLGHATAVRVLMRVPILWITGFYRLTRSLLFGFVPLKQRKGDFNIDIKDVSISVITTLVHSNDTNSVKIDAFDVGISWHRMAFNFDNVMGRLGLGESIVSKLKVRIVQELEDYSEAVFRCAFHNPSRGVELCMRAWWGARGWPWPWAYPQCNKA